MALRFFLAVLGFTSGFVACLAARGYWKPVAPRVNAVAPNPVSQAPAPYPADPLDEAQAGPIDALRQEARELRRRTGRMTGEEILARIEELRGVGEKLIQAKDGPKLLLLIRELAALGPDAYAAIPRTQRSPVVPDLRPLLPASKSIEPEGVLEYFRGVRTAPWTAEEKERVLTELTAHANPVIASSAAATRVFLSPQATGILVEWVSPDSVAAQYGVLSGDIVLSVNDQPAFDTAEMNRELNSTPKGQHARIRIFRNGQESVLSWVVTRSDSGLVGAWVEKP